MRLWKHMDYRFQIDVLRNEYESASGKAKTNPSLKVGSLKNQSSLTKRTKSRIEG